MCHVRCVAGVAGSGRDVEFLTSRMTEGNRTYRSYKNIGRPEMLFFVDLASRDWPTRLEHVKDRIFQFCGIIASGSVIPHDNRTCRAQRPAASRKSPSSIVAIHSAPEGWRLNARDRDAHPHPRRHVALRPRPRRERAPSAPAPCREKLPRRDAPRNERRSAACPRLQGRRLRGVSRRRGTRVDSRRGAPVEGRGARVALAAR